MIGAKTERIRIVRRTRGKDANGDYELTDTTVAERWAKVVPVAGYENEMAGQLRALLNYKIDADLYGVSVTTDDKVQWLTRGTTIELNLQEVRLSSVRNIDSVLMCANGKPDVEAP